MKIRPLNKQERAMCVLLRKLKPNTLNQRTVEPLLAPLLKAHMRKEFLSACYETTDGGAVIQFSDLGNIVIPYL
jgi:hypothetical protein